MSGVEGQKPVIWRNPPESFALQVDEVHIWRLGLDWSAAQIQQLGQVLAQDERERAGRYRSERDRMHFIARWSCLRWLLGRYLDVPPSEIGFAYGPYGKPELAADFVGSDVHFNLSHSAGVALLGFTRCGEIGIDIERIRLDFDDQAIGGSFFSSVERAALAALPVAARVEAFFACWTRKEAYLKARGDGLSIPLDQFDVSLAPGEPARLLGARGYVEDIARWNLFDLKPESGYAGAVCVSGTVNSLVCHVLDDPLALRLG